MEEESDSRSRGESEGRNHVNMEKAERNALRETGLRSGSFGIRIAEDEASVDKREAELRKRATDTAKNKKRTQDDRSRSDGGSASRARTPASSAQAMMVSRNSAAASSVRAVPLSTGGSINGDNHPRQHSRADRVQRSSSSSSSSAAATRRSASLPRDDFATSASVPLLANSEPQAPGASSRFPSSEEVSQNAFALQH